MSKTRFTLRSRWEWRLGNANGCSKAQSIAGLREWSPTSSFPSVIHMELLASKHIPDPNIGQNEQLIQWVAECDWEYRCNFHAPKNAAGFEHVDLMFDGLDTIATVLVNGQKVGQSENMFVPLRASVKDLLLWEDKDALNELHITFQSPLKWGAIQEKKYGKRKMLIRDPKRMYTRKAQCHYGWDWGPVILTSGPYMPVHLEMYNVRIENVHVVTAIRHITIKSAEVTATVEFVAGLTKPATVKLQIINDQCQPVAVASANIDKSNTTSVLTTSISNPKLWWPNGHGPQSLYKARTTLYDINGRVLDTRIDQFGVRKIKLIQRPLCDEPGETFMFNVNGQDIFSQGCNWIPADNLLPRISRSRYFAWIKLAQRCNMNMIRVWGGGIYETDDFYDACDEMGLLVWQDYAFACGDYPIHDEFLANVRKEAEYQTCRLRNRACLALLCGGNEDFMTIDLFFKDIKFDHFDLQGPFDDKPFPQRKIYLDLLPKMVSSRAPGVDYWANSPYKGDPSDDPTMGDAHVWEVWHGKQLSYQKYGDLSARFVSEFGMHGFPIMRTTDLFFSDSDDRQPQSEAIDCHNKGHGAETRIARYLSENFRYDMKLENFVYCSQLLQSEAYSYALHDWKRKFKGSGREYCAGALIWQLNDIYPVTSWAFVDYFLRPKPAFYTIRRSCASVSVGIERRPWSRCWDEDHPPETLIPSFEIFAHNMTMSPVEARLELTGYDMYTQTSISFPAIHTPRQVTLAAGQNTELYSLAHKPPPGEEDAGPITEKSLIVLCARLVDPVSGMTLSRIVNWPEPFRYLRWASDTSVVAKVTDHPAGSVWEKQVHLSTNRPVKGCFVSEIGFSSDADEPVWEDNMVDLLPGEDIVLNVNGLPSDHVEVRFLNDWEL